MHLGKGGDWGQAEMPNKVKLAKMDSSLLIIGWRPFICFRKGD
jgi:hypothetical protein